MESLECCGLRNSYISIIPDFENFTTIGKLIGNKDPIQLTFISSSCLWFGIRVGLFWTSSSCYLWDGKLRASHLDNYLILSLASFPQCMKEGSLYLQHILNTSHFWYYVMFYSNTLTQKIIMKNWFLYKALNKFKLLGWKLQIIYISN